MKDLIHILFAGAVGALVAYLNVLAVPLIVLGTVMVVDWFTGMAGASATGKLSSRVGVIGIIKKLCYLALVVVGGVIDYLINSALVSIGISLQINYCFGMIITVWLIINELISILENLGEMGVPLPSFLMGMIKTLKGKVEEQGGKHYKEDEK
jgi:toxin secretion/phage lysis holin